MTKPTTTPVKVGTIPMNVIFRYRYGMAVGQVVEFRINMHGSKYQTAIVREVTDARIFLDLF